MKRNKNVLAITLIISITHCIIGNIIGISFIDSTILDLIFFPYSFIAGMSAFAGWDILSYMLELVAFIIISMILYLAVLFLKKN